MGWPQCNTTLEDMVLQETPLFNSNDLTFHRLIIVISAMSGVVAIIVSLGLMFMHSIHYSRPTEQRHIIRILFMVPVYGLVSFLSIIFYYHSIYYEVLRDCYEAFAIASFFSLLCAYLADDLHHQKEYFRKTKPKPWIWPMRWFQKCCGGEHGALRTPGSGLTWFNVIWVAVYQYCFVRVSMTITAVLTQYWDRYCLESLNPAFAHVWVMVIEAIAVTITMYCIIQFYVQIRADIGQHKPILKVLAIKLVIFLSFWQTMLISFLTSSGAINASDKVQTPDIKVGIPSMLLCVEMALFSIFHIWSFSYKPYVIGSQQHQATYGHLKDNEQSYYQGGPLGLRAIGQCFNPWDLIKATGRSAKWLFVDRRKRTEDASYSSITAPNSTTDVQKMYTLDSEIHNTAYEGAGGADGPAPLPVQRLSNTEEGSGLLASVQQPAHYNPDHNPYLARDSDSSSATPWIEVESKEYLQDQQMRRHDEFEPVQAKNDPYASGHDETQMYSPQSQSQPQQIGVLRPSETGLQPQPQPLGKIPQHQQQHLPFVTRQDIEDMQTGRHGQGQAQGQTVPLHPGSLASVNPNSKPKQQGSYMVHSSQQQMPPSPRPRKADNEQFR